MNLTVGCLIAGMVVFAGLSGYREISHYKRAVQGEVHYLVSRQRRNRRLFISMLLLLEALLLFFGFFVLHFGDSSSLIFWIAPIVVVGFIVHLSFQDWKETKRDVDRIFKEDYLSAIKKIKEEN